MSQNGRWTLSYNNEGPIVAVGSHLLSEYNSFEKLFVWSKNTDTMSDFLELNIKSIIQRQSNPKYDRHS